ncbi:Formyl-CoA transferase [Nocardioides sp. JS614]|nr:Formyl-CoA transferase [Nocardioides sp. JS614]
MVKAEAAVLPLSGVRVVDLTRALSGPFCTMLLGDQGAEVVKIERPVVGDDTRRQSNPMVGTENSAFLAVNRNKRSVAVDLRAEAGVEVVRRLVAVSDVVVENFRPGKAEQMGLGYEQLRELNPGLVYCSISGWGSDGPYAARGGYASTAEAAGGLMSVTGERGRGPVKVGVSIVDSLTGLYAKDAITAALLARVRTGVGQKVETSLLESTVSILSMSAYAYLLGGVVAGRWGSEHQWNVPWKAFETTDGYVVVASSSEEQWRKICVGIERPDLLEDPRFTTMADRAAHREILYALLDEVFATHTTHDWVARLDAVGAAAAPVNTIDQVFADPQVLARDMLQSVEHPTLGPIAQVGHAQKLHGTPHQITLPPPLLGQHTREVLTDLGGYTPDEIDELARDGVVGVADHPAATA